MTLWTAAKDMAIRAGFEPWLRPVWDAMRARKCDEEELSARALFSRLKRDAVCVDVGCNKGKLLDPMRRAAPEGMFFAFEPVPYLYDLLKAKYRRDPRVRLFNFAVAATNGNASFFVNDRNYGLSGLSRRPGRMDGEPLRGFEVPVCTLDRVLGAQRVDFIKIDVEGAEFDVLSGGYQVISRSRPFILFEFGLGGADYFGVDADQMYRFFDALKYDLFALDEFVRDCAPLSPSDFGQYFFTNEKYNFVASPR